MARRACKWIVTTAGFAALLGIPSVALADETGSATPTGTAPALGEGWPAYGGDPGGSKYSALRDITPANVGSLEPLWVHHTGEYSSGHEPGGPGPTAYELTPIFVDGLLYGCSPWNRIFALDPETGEEKWDHDPGVDHAVRFDNQAICRGVAAWRDPRPEADPTCRRRIFTATNDARLIAVDAEDGRPCADFGEAGEVDLEAGVGAIARPGEYQVTSAPVIFEDLVIVGSAIGDNQRVDAPSGVVRAYDTRTGALRWAWDPASRPDAAEGAAGPEEQGDQEPSPATPYRLGTANVWAPMSVDTERDLVFLPTGNSAPDYYGALRAGTDEYASAVVALRASTGERVWHFQTVHHDLWDYDVPAQPTLASIHRDGKAIPVVVQTTKMGHVFVLNRDDGVPFFPVEERPVPQGGVPGETVSPTQPFPTRPPPLVPARIDEEDAWGVMYFDRRGCRERIAALRHDGIFTPPTREGTLMVPGNGGGSNWGGVAVDPVRQVMIANVTHLPFVVSLFPAEEYAARRAAEPDKEISPQKGTPYGMRREIFLSGLDLPCVKPPWGMLTAVDLTKGEILWQVPLGTVRDLLPIPIPLTVGTPTFGGPLVTASGLVFIGATLDHYLRAFDIESGEELWRGRLDAPAFATPMTFRVKPGGRQIVVVAAGGNARSGSKVSDTLVAFALPE